MVAVEPQVSAVLSGGPPGPTRIDGLGAGMMPEVLNVDVIDEVIAVSEEVAYQTMKSISTAKGCWSGCRLARMSTRHYRSPRNMDPIKPL